MPLMIDPAAIEAVKRRADLAALVRAHGVELKRQGRQLVGRCPFHSPDRTPSFFVDPAMGTWKCFGRCAAGGEEKAGGDAIRFVMVADKLTFREAFVKLGGVLDAKPLPAPRAKKRESKTTSGNGDRVANARLQILGRVVEFYRRTFLATPAPQQYLAARGIGNAELLGAYRIGYADGSLLGKAKGALRRDLIDAGVITPSGRELLGGCVVFPLVDPSTGVVVNLYGRSIVEDRHLYLPGPHRGLFNAETLRGVEEIILTESVIDAMSCIEAGVMNVLPLYGVSGLTPDHETLLAIVKPKRVALCLDNDEAGRAATAKLAERLSAEVDVRVIELDRKDLNEVIVIDGVDALRRVLRGEGPSSSASPTSPENGAAEEETRVHVSEGEMRFVSGPRTYTVRGIESKGRAALRVGLKLACGEARVIDAVDLISARSRNGFLARVAEAGIGERIEVERDLMLLLDAIERHHAGGPSEPVPVLTMTESDRREALALLGRDDLLDVVAADMETLGYVGESVNKKLGYLVAVSRKLPSPLSMVIMSQSGSGKSALADVLELVIAPEEIVLFSRLSAQALYYMDRDALRHKFVVVEERAGSADADYSIRSLQSKKKLILAVPVKDPASGKLKTQVFEVMGPAAFLETTTETAIHPENGTRCFEVYCDESAEQTRRIHEMQRHSKTLEGRRLDRDREAIIRRHHNAQRLLEPVSVVIPFAPVIEFPSQWLRTRRDHLRFLNLIEAVAFLHQHRREHRRDDDGAVFIEATSEDYAAAYALAGEVLGQTLVDLKRPAAELLAVFRSIAAKKGDGTVTRRELREATGLPDHRVIALLYDLTRLEYVEILSGSFGKTIRYRLTALPGAGGGGVLPGLTTPGELREKLESGAKSTNLENLENRFQGSLKVVNH